MAITWYSSAGTPSDSVGADGDLNWDTTNRITWGPKGKVTAGSWTGTAYSNIGPTGPAMLSGSGQPSNNLGQNGQGYTDAASGLTYLKSSNAWTQVGNLVGLTGSPGTTLMTALATSPGQNGAFSGVTLSSTPYVVPCPGTTTPAQFSPPSSSALMGVYAYASVATTLALYNVTTSTTVFSVAIAANASIGGQNYTATQYPLVANNVYQWQCTGSASCTFQMLPFYLMPSNTNAPAIGMSGPAGFSSAQTFSTTATRLPIFGAPLSAGTWAYAPPRNGGVYTAQATYWPSSGTASSSSVTLTLNYGLLTNGQGGATSITFTPVTANGLPQTILTPRLTDQTSTLTSSYYFYWTATGTGTGTLAVNLYAVV